MLYYQQLDGGLPGRRQDEAAAWCKYEHYGESGMSM